MFKDFSEGENGQCLISIRSKLVFFFVDFLLFEIFVLGAGHPEPPLLSIQTGPGEVLKGDVIFLPQSKV